MGGSASKGSASKGKSLNGIGRQPSYGSYDGTGTSTPKPRSAMESPFFGGRSGINIDVEPIGENKESRKMGDVGLIITVVNVFAGLGLLSQPYAIALLGWGGVLVLAFVCLVMNWTAKIIIRCMDLLGANTFPLLAEGSMGGIGRNVVALGVLLEVIGAMITCFEFIYQQLMALLPQLSPVTVLVISFAACLPTIWILEFSRLSFLSGVGAFSNCILGVVMAYVSLVYKPLPHRTVENWHADPSGFALASGIFVFASGAHATLPGVYNQSRCDANRWDELMNICFLIIFFIYALMGCCGYYTYGDSVHVIVTQDLVQYPGGFLPQMVTVFIIIGSFCKVSPLMVVLGELTEGWIGIQEDKWLQRVYRTAIFSLIVICAYGLRQDVDLLEALTAAIATSITALVVPAVSYLIVTGAHLCICDNQKAEISTWVGLFLSMLLSVLLLVGNFIGLAQRFDPGYQRNN